MNKLTKVDREKRLRDADERRVKKFMEETGIPMNIERARALHRDVMENRVKREIFEQAAQLADLVEALQEADYGAANSGGAVQVAKAIRACGDIFFGKHKPETDHAQTVRDEMDDFYAGKSDIEVARHINLALLLCSGISEQNAGFDTIVSLNDDGLAAIARIVGKVRESARRTSGE
jgi:hypothetical protein